MARFRKRSVEIDAWRINQHSARPSWASHAEKNDDGTLALPTPEGWQTARPGDFLIRDASGAVYAMPSAMFTQIYEPCANKLTLIAAE